MTTNPTLQRLFLALALVLLLFFAWTGLIGGSNLLTPSHTPGQRFQAWSQIALGFFALLSAVTTFRGHRWQSLALTAFGLTLAVAAGLFVVAWNHMTLFIGMVSAAVALLMGLGIRWLLRTSAA